MARTATVGVGGSGSTSSGNPALSERVVEKYFVPSAERAKTMTAGGAALKTVVLLAVLIAGGAWGWASATTPVGSDLGSGYGNTTVTIPGGFWLASFGAFFVAIFLVMNPMRAGLFGIL